MKSNKGFTLIELLAVIVILAIIALITTVTIRNVLEKARKSAAIDSAYGYIDAIEKQILINQMNDNPDITDGTYEDVDELTDTYKVKIKGSYPTTASVIVENGKVKSANFIINKYEIECISNTHCEVKGTKKTLTAAEIGIDGIEGIENVEQALNDLHSKLS